MPKLTVKELDEEVIRVLDEIEGVSKPTSKPNILKRLQDRVMMKGVPGIKPETKA